MADFSHLKDLEQQGNADRPYKFEQIKGAPTIWLLPATDANPAFQNESLRRANARASSNRRSRRVTNDTIKSARDEDRELVARFCARKWDVVDAKGKAVEFTPDNCLEFFQALPDWLFDDLRTFVTDPGNFVGEGADGIALGEA